MAKLKINLKGEDVIDNAVIYLEDPQETIPYLLNPESDTEWTRDVRVPVTGDLDYSLYVLAFSGTKFTCTITNEKDESIELTGVTGRTTRHRAHISGAKQFK